MISRKSSQWIVTFSLVGGLPALLSSSLSFSDELIHSLTSQSLTGGSVEVITLKTHSRLMLPIDEGIPVETQFSSEGFTLRVKGISISDLGAPQGEEAEWHASFKALHDSRLKMLTFKEDLDGVQIMGQWKFPTGRQARVKPKMETFDYRQKNPPHYVLDFWLKDSPTIAEAEEARQHFELKNSIRKVRTFEHKISQKKKELELEQAKEIDQNLLCHMPMTSENDAFVRLYPYHRKVEFKKWFPSLAPDDHYAYEYPSENSKIADYVRKAIYYYRSGRYGLAIRMVDFYTEAMHQKNKYSNEIKFLKANALLKVGVESESNHILNDLIEDSAGTQEALQSSLFVLTKLIENNQYLAALNRFLWLIRMYPDYPLNWVFHLGAAECYYILKNTDYAAKEYRWVVENSKDNKIKAEASAKLGDLYLGRFQYEQALATYYQALKHFPDEISHYPVIYLNRGEALYQLGEYEKARESLLEFMHIAKNHPGGWRASLRLGEIEARKSREGEAAQRSEVFFYDTVNHYPFTPGEILGRLRLAPCGDHGKFKKDTFERFIRNEANHYSAALEIVSKDYVDFKSLLYIRGMIALGEEDGIVEKIIQELPHIESQGIKKKMNLIIHQFFRKVISKALKNGEKFKALSFYTRFIPKIPTPVHELDFDYLLGLSQVASDLHLVQLANGLLDKYDQWRRFSKYSRAAPLLLSGRDSVTTNSPAGDKEKVKGRGAIESLKFDLKNSERYYAEARTLWMLNRNEPLGLWTSQIRELLGKVSDESGYSFEREVISGLLDEKEGKRESTIQRVKTAQLMGSHPAIDAWLGRLLADIGNLDEALSIYQNLEKKLILKMKQKPVELESNNIDVFLGVDSAPSLAELIVREGNILERQGRWGDAATTYSRAMENNVAGNQIVYRYANSLFHIQDPTRKKVALSMLNDLVKKKSADRDEEFWRKLAEAKLSDEKLKEIVNNNNVM